MGWFAAGGAYEVALVEGRVAAGTVSGRAAGRQVGSLPKAPRGHPEVQRLRGFAAWLERHEAEAAGKPADPDSRATDVPEFAGALFRCSVRAARDTALDHRVSGSLAICRVRDAERVAWSEGTRRTAALYAGRAFEEGTGG
ncbi:hypothetical protein [Streptomyces brasiliscabiei]|uniref:hypothetical protein n=1 Tax=Streptomyces brasiliscabiei TaxID=2736302 RepID=UPI001C109280|nr:hypothetical protein [Streptomyces brasiliscabiei]